ncbi:hypothetical protein Tco_0730778 [Tanacetum coccineum]
MQWFIRFLLKVPYSINLLDNLRMRAIFSLKAFLKRSKVVIDLLDNCFIHCLALPFKVKGKAISITWPLDTPGE